MHWMPCACCFDLANAGNSIAAKMAMIAIATTSSIKVNADFTPRFPAATQRRNCSLALKLIFMDRLLQTKLFNSLFAQAKGISLGGDWSPDPTYSTFPILHAANRGRLPFLR